VCIFFFFLCVCGCGPWIKSVPSGSPACYLGKRFKSLFFQRARAQQNPRSSVVLRMGVVGCARPARWGSRCRFFPRSGRGWVRMGSAGRVKKNRRCLAMEGWRWGGGGGLPGLCQPLAQSSISGQSPSSFFVCLAARRGLAPLSIPNAIVAVADAETPTAPCLARHPRSRHHNRMHGARLWLCLAGVETGLNLPGSYAMLCRHSARTAGRPRCM
jgi:hypothetical protein